MKDKAIVRSVISTETTPVVTTEIAPAPEVLVPVVTMAESELISVKDSSFGSTYATVAYTAPFSYSNVELKNIYLYVLQGEQTGSAQELVNVSSVVTLSAGGCQLYDPYAPKGCRMKMSTGMDSVNFWLGVDKTEPVGSKKYTVFMVAFNEGGAVVASSDKYVLAPPLSK